MKTPDEIKRGLECCINLTGLMCPYCPYAEDGDISEMCREDMSADALALIQQLEAERDAAVNGLVGTCQVCRWEDTDKCASCHFNPLAWNVYESNWQWRGVQKED